MAAWLDWRGPAPSRAYPAVRRGGTARGGGWRRGKRRRGRQPDCSRAGNVCVLRESPPERRSPGRGGEPASSDAGKRCDHRGARAERDCNEHGRGEPDANTDAHGNAHKFVSSGAPTGQPSAGNRATTGASDTRGHGGTFAGGDRIRAGWDSTLTGPEDADAAIADAPADIDTDAHGDPNSDSISDHDADANQHAEAIADAGG